MLTEQEMPTQWYNIVADMPNKPLPPLHPGTKQPLKPEDLYPLFARELVKQEFSTERYIEIPDEVQDLYKIWRSTPLVRAHALEKALDTPAKIYFKNEGTSPAGSHKPNTAIASLYCNLSTTLDACCDDEHYALGIDLLACYIESYCA